ncbi:glycosyltransferase [Candidatus Latescibacterota bacterium]
MKQHIAANARRIVEENYSWESIIERLMSLYNIPKKQKQATNRETSGLKGT